MLARSHPLVTRSDYEAMPSGPPYAQLIAGEIIMSPSPSTQHQRIVMRLSSVLHNFVQEHRSGEVFVAPLDVFLDDLNVVQPDIAYVSSARSGLVTEAGIEGAPDLCIEVLSRRTAPNDKITKKKIFSAAGVQEYWLVNPDEGSIAVFRLPSDSGEAGTLFERCNKPALVSEMFPGLRIDLDQIFAR